MKFITRLVALGVVAALALTGCGSASNLEGENESSGDANTLVVGSQDYYSNEILAEIYAQSLEKVGYKVDRQLRIGQREVYVPELQAGKIDVLPEYSGNLLQYFKADTTARTPEQVSQELPGVLPKGLKALDQAPATDQDSYVVTKAFAEEHSLKQIGDLAGMADLQLAGNSELESRPYGPSGLRDVYGVDVTFKPAEDSGGPLTVKALRDGQVQLVDIYSAAPTLADGDLVVLEDPKGLFLSSNVVPIVSERVNDKTAETLNQVSRALTVEDLIAMNKRSVDDKESASAIAADWLKSKGLA
jgi:glycine betaine/choline-binding protein of an ABC-type transport system